mgnify:CR=1 FL=1
MSLDKNKLKKEINLFANISTKYPLIYQESDPEEDTEPAVFDVEEVNDDDDDDDDDYDDNDNDNDSKAMDDVNNEKEEEPKHGTEKTNAEKSDGNFMLAFL